MIQLRPDHLMFTLPNGESVPCSAQEVTVELIGEAVKRLEPEMVQEAASAVMHYFREELGKTFITVGEFAVELVRVLRGFGLKVSSPEIAVPSKASAGEFDLLSIATASGVSCELLFFQHVRAAMLRRAGESGDRVRFTGLRHCVKRLAGAQRWSGRCQRLNDEIVLFLRDCYSESFAGKQPSAAMEVR